MRRQRELQDTGLFLQPTCDEGHFVLGHLSTSNSFRNTRRLDLRAVRAITWPPPFGQHTVLCRTVLLSYSSPAASEPKGGIRAAWGCFSSPQSAHSNSTNRPQATPASSYIQREAYCNDFLRTLKACHLFRFASVDRIRDYPQRASPQPRSSLQDAQSHVRSSSFLQTPALVASVPSSVLRVRYGIACRYPIVRAAPFKMPCWEHLSLCS